MTITTRFMKKVVVWFWALWWLAAFMNDFLASLIELGLITITGPKLGNYPFLVQSLVQYSPPGWLAPFLYGGVIFWSCLATLALFFAALTPFEPRTRWYRRVNLAFSISVGLWLAFFLADQVILNFDLEQNHIVQGGFQVLCFLGIYILPDEDM